MYRALAACMLMLGTIAHAQVDEVAILIKAAKLMNQRGYNKTHYFRAKAEEKLRREGRYFDLERVEVTGFVSADATAKEFSKLFDDYVKPSALPEEKTDAGYLRRWWEALNRKRRLPGAAWNDSRGFFVNIMPVIMSSPRSWLPERPTRDRMCYVS